MRHGALRHASSNTCRLRVLLLRRTFRSLQQGTVKCMDSPIPMPRCTVCRGEASSQIRNIFNICIDDYRRHKTTPLQCCMVFRIDAIGLVRFSGLAVRLVFFPSLQTPNPVSIKDPVTVFLLCSQHNTHLQGPLHAGVQEKRGKSEHVAIFAQGVSPIAHRPVPGGGPATV